MENKILYVKDYTNNSTYVQIKHIENMLPEIFPYCYETDKHIEISFEGIDMGIGTVIEYLHKLIPTEYSDNITISGIDYVISAYIKYLDFINEGNVVEEDTFSNLVKEEHKQTKEYKDFQKEKVEDVLVKTVLDSQEDINSNNEQIIPEEMIKKGKCPECGSKLIFRERCKVCSNEGCAWSACS